MLKFPRWARAMALALAIVCAPATMAPAQTDVFAGFSDTVTAQCRHWTAITPNDSANLTVLPKAIYVGTGGDVKMIGVDAPTGAAGLVWKNVPDGAMISARPRRVLATGTTATDMLACY